ncbi:hypothetical protein [Streptosporangium sp. NPDC002607]
MSKVVESFGTGFVLTTIVKHDDGDYRWTRRPGPHRGGAIRTPDPTVLAAVRAVPRGRVGLTVPEPKEGAGVTYRTGQARSIAAILLGLRPGAEKFDIEQVAMDTLVETGTTLARLHTVPVPQADLPSPAGPQRLLSWLRSGQGPTAAPELHSHATGILGHDRISTVEAWCVPPSEGRHVLLHGAPGHGILLPLTQDQDGCLLTGEDLSAGPPEFDVGWLIGELVEFRETFQQPGHNTFPALDYDALIGCVLDGYNAPLDLAAVGRAAALRFLTHTHDFAAYVGWHDVLADYLKIVADAIDAADAGQLLPSSSHKVSH